MLLVSAGCDCRRRLRPHRPLRIRASGCGRPLGSVHKSDPDSTSTLAGSRAIVAVGTVGGGSEAWQQVAASMPLCRPASVSGSGQPARHAGCMHRLYLVSAMPCVRMPSDAAPTPYRARAEAGREATSASFSGRCRLFAGTNRTVLRSGDHPLIFQCSVLISNVRVPRYSHLGPQGPTCVKRLTAPNRPFI